MFVYSTDQIHKTVSALGAPALFSCVSVSFSLPGNRRYNPSVGNGHLASTIYGDAVFVNGIYNGETGTQTNRHIDILTKTYKHTDTDTQIYSQTH